jgi:NADH:ubiquinone oxidoreductase subunit 5 (subunit L)/multisubunit Na+/H+ antiporter MnhA subunit
MNKVGDVTLFCAIIILFIIFNDTSFQHISENISFFLYKVSIGPFSCVVGELIGILFFFAAIAKSAQIGLHT